MHEEVAVVGVVRVPGPCGGVASFTQIWRHAVATGASVIQQQKKDSNHKHKLFSIRFSVYKLILCECDCVKGSVCAYKSNLCMHIENINPLGVYKCVNAGTYDILNNEPE